MSKLENVFRENNTNKQEDIYISLKMCKTVN